MKLLIKLKYLNFLLLCFFVLFSCNEDNNADVFDQSPSDRVAERITELQNLLLSQQNGFRAVYFPKDDQRGGFTIYMKFNADGTVRQTSDFDDDSTLQNSSYDVRLGTTTELVFTTRNHITKATDPTAVVENINGFPTGIGFFGTSVFQYFSNDNGVLTFRDIRNSDTASLILYPTNFTDFDAESVASVNATYANRQEFKDVDCETASVYDSLILEVPDGGETITYVLSYSPNIIFFNGETTDSEGVVSERGIGVAFTIIDGQTALTISPALEVGGNTFEDFILDTSTGKEQYVSTSNGATAIISKTALSKPSGADISNLPGATFFYDTADGTNPLTSPCFQELVFDQINANLDAQFGPGVLKFSFLAFFIDFNSDSCRNQLSIWVENAAGATFRANYCYTRASIQNNLMFQNYVGPLRTTGNDPLLQQSLRPLLDFFGSTNGLLYTNHGPFRASINNYINLSGAFTSMDNESLRIYGLFF